MADYLKSLLLTIIIAGIIFILYNGCASRGIPGGGPVDKTPPMIVNTYPAADSINVKQLSVIRIRFSEAIDESSVANNIFISPPLKFNAEWESYTELNIILKDSLKSNQTYVVVLGAKIKDIHNNKLSSSFQLAFSTGNKIDRGSILGRVYGLGRNQSITIFAFKLDSDTLQFDRNRPDYVSQTGDNGKFALNYIRPGLFRVFAVDDRDNNLRIDADLEKIGIPLKDVFLDSSGLAVSGLNFRLTKIDTIAPVLANIRSPNSTQFNMRLSERIILSSPGQLSVIDSISGEKVDVLSTSVNIEADNILEVFTSRMDSGEVYLCTTKALKDSSGNYAKDTTLAFIAGRYVQPDTFKILNFTPQDSAWSVHPLTELYLEVNNPLNKESIEKNLKIISADNDTIKGKFLYPSAYEAEFLSSDLYTLDKIYAINLNMKGVKNVWGDSLGDSLLIRHFKINNGDDYGEIAGTVNNEDSLKHPIYIEAVKINKKNEKYSVWTMNKKPYILNYVPDGNYQLNAYLDLDSSRTYSAGNLFPFHFSEPFIFSSDTVKVRKRWETSGINISLPKAD